MKTIFDKVDPKYLECGSGTCDHLEHKLLPYLLVVSLSCDSLLRHKKQKSFLVVIAHVCVYWCFCPNTDTMTPYLWRIPILDSGVAIRFYLQTDLLALISTFKEASKCS